MRSMVEGAAPTGLRHDMLHNTVDISKDIARWNAQHVDTACVQPCIPCGIVGRARPAIMGLAIHLDRQLSLRTVKIEHISPGWMLPPEFESVWAGAQFAPQQYVGQAHRAAQLACARYRRSRPIQHRAPPSTMLRMAPLPETSSGRTRSFDL